MFRVIKVTKMPEIENLSILSTLIIVLELQRTLSFEGQIHWKITIFDKKETYIYD